MKKCLINLTTAMTIATTVLPLSACSFNFYSDKTKTEIESKIAGQISTVVKSLFYSNSLSTDTGDNINNFFNTGDASRGSIDINNMGSGNFNNWGDFQTAWGDQNQIKTRGFNQDKYIVSNGSGTLTKSVKSKQAINNNLQKLKQIDIFGSLNNNDIYQLAIADGAKSQGVITNFLNKIKNSQPKILTSILSKQLLYDNLITPITSWFNLLLNGQWTNKATVPKDYDTLKQFMQNWKDGTQPYSQWINPDNTWGIQELLTKGWKPDDFAMMYPAGTLLNYLFYQIGAANNLPAKYLGELITENLSDTNKLVSILGDYMKNIINNPKSIIILLSALTPVIKQFIFDKGTSVTIGLKRLTIGEIYPTSKTTETYNIKDVLNKIQGLLSNRQALEAFLKNFLTSPFFYDEKIHKFGDFPLGNILSTFTSYLDQIVDKIVNLVETHQTTIQSVFQLINQFIGQYTGSQGVVFDFENFSSFLLNKTNGLITLLASVVDTLKDIFDNKDPVTSKQIQTLYQMLGGVNDANAPNFKPNSVLAILKQAFADSNSFLYSILNVLYKGTGVQNSIAGFIVSQNNNWIKTHYSDYFDYSNVNTKVIINQWDEKNTNTDQIINVNFTFSFQFNNQKQEFTVSGIINNSLKNFNGINNFRFQTITKN